MKNALDITRNNRMPTFRIPDVEDMFERMLRSPFSIFDEMRPTLSSDDQWMQPNIDVDETEHAYVLTVDLPGVKKDDIKVDLSDNVLTLSGERKNERESKEKGARRYERSYGRFSRSFTLPSTVEADKVEASLEDGVLRIALPKSETSKPRNIQIQSGKGGFFSKLVGSSDKKGEKETEKNEQKH